METGHRRDPEEWLSRSRDTAAYGTITDQRKVSPDSTPSKEILTPDPLFGCNSRTPDGHSLATPRPGKSYAKLAAKYGVKSTLIHGIVHRTLWKQVTID